MALERELEVALRLADQAGAEILDHYSRDIVAEEKIGYDSFAEPVTAADRAASRIIVDGLAAEFPGDAILSEEEVDVPSVRLARSRVWIIDPIDGTAGFVRKDGDFAVQIGLAENGKPVVGVVALPFHRITYFATVGGGAFKRTESGVKKLQASTETDYSKMMMAVSRNHPSSKIRTVLQSLDVRGEMNRGSVGLKIGLIAEQTCDLYIHLSPRTKLWDTSAPQIILEEAGGKLTDLFGEEFRYDIEDLQNHGGICATNGAAHSQTIDRLRPLLNEFGRLKYRSKAS